ncbi:hypothetical protein [Micromonospora sp. NBC_01813]|uniref:hypothetical protein n=1 Tax=Micromonospora sp. NBC_01813 TaxID=2975988 RepID=UPI002DDA6DDA|nr:hypothetical protein [Micromonospora sp. NBC_01813]WSA10428.1 hypothetical protein OG958_06460 [Micromonospora sp. NBC_01813]
MSSGSPAAEDGRPGVSPAYQPGDLIWIHRAGVWRSGVVLTRSSTAATIRYRVTGAEGTGVDTVVLGRPELVHRVGPLPPPGPPVPVRADSPATPLGRANGATPTRPLRRPAGRPKGREDLGQPPAATPNQARTARQRTNDRLVELRIFVRAAGCRPTELPLGCAVDRRTGTVHLRLPDGRSSQLDLVLARAASMILHEAVLTCLDPRELRFWVQR